MAEDVLPIQLGQLVELMAQRGPPAYTRLAGLAVTLHAIGRQGKTPEEDKVQGEVMSVGKLYVGAATD